MQKILIPTDFSEIARDAVRYAKKYIAAPDAEFYMLHAYNQPESTDMLISIVDILKEEADKMLNDEAAFLKKELGVSADKIFLISVLGEVEDTIKKNVAKHNIDLVVMGTSGASGIKELLVGSNTVKVINAAHTPILAVPKMNEETYLDTIVLALDNESIEDEHRLKMVKEIADTNDAEIILLHVSTKDEEPFCFNIQLQNKLRKFFGRMDIECVSLKGNDVEQEINDFVWENEIGMIVLLPHKMSLTQKLFGKRSVSKRINFHSKIPVLSIG
jgi:nucleotide-binding universal stress UspA family protein